MPSDRQCQIEAHKIHRGKELEVRLSLALALSTIQVTVRFSSVKFLKGMNEYYQSLRGTGEERNILLFQALVISAATTHKTFGPTYLTSTYSVCTRKVFDGIGHQTQAIWSGVRCSNH
ncbi:hypothetical protein TNCV_3094211 [Trichonephila clavipes]|nr:hypothetical protein TNCV_3094211 [Trichonephila clavipes]